MGLLEEYFKPKKAREQHESQGIQQTASEPKEQAPNGDKDFTISSAPVAKQAPFSATEEVYREPSSPTGSRRPSRSDSGSGRSDPHCVIKDIRCEVMASWLNSQQEERLWTTGEEGEGVVLKKSRGQYTCAPTDLESEQDGFFQAVQTLNVKVAMTVNTRVIRLLLHANDLPYIQLRGGLRLQVLPNLACLHRCAKHQFAAFVADIGLLVVWDDDPRKILDRVHRLEDLLMETVWNDGSQAEGNEKRNGPTVQVHEVDVESLAADRSRKVVLIQPVLTALSIALCMASLGAGWSKIGVELMVDRAWIRIAFAACYLPQAWLALFFFQALVYDVAQLIGPVSQMNENSKTYSGQAPRRMHRDDGPLPHVTIQCPVYKESLTATIEPTIRSLKAAISTYELQGGTANIFVNDDGMQLISEDDTKARQDFYDEHNIGWVARPKHNPKPKQDGEVAFTRRGKFKKASNMNFAMSISARVEDRLNILQRARMWSAEEERAAYVAALQQVQAEDQGRTWAEGNIRIGDFILLVDSDTRVPTDCLLDAVSEMDQSPQVAILQYSSGVMHVTNSFFENGVSFFTNLIYTQVRYAVSNGDVAPFVGHNAVLRWDAIQDIAYHCPLDNREKFWSESTVSEDFDMALRLQSLGYIVRLAAYTGEGFKEGVSLSVYDELARWEKYAYGCSELVFNPLIEWLTHGPFTSLFRRFLISSMPLPSKLTILAYIGTYYALGSAWALTLFNYFGMGFFNGYLDHYYMDSFRIYFAIIVVFYALGNISLAWLRYRNEEKALIPALIENLTWVPMFTVFLGGVSIHISQALLSHLFSIDMTWGATAKEAERIPFFQEIPRVLKRFKFTFLFCLSCTAMMVVMAHWAPPFWRISSFIAIFPLATTVFSHCMLPIVLNPNLMLFTW